MPRARNGARRPALRTRRPGLGLTDPRARGRASLREYCYTQGGQQKLASGRAPSMRPASAAMPDGSEVRREGGGRAEAENGRSLTLSRLERPTVAEGCGRWEAMFPGCPIR